MDINYFKISKLDYAFELLPTKEQKEYLQQVSLSTDRTTMKLLYICDAKMYKYALCNLHKAFPNARWLNDVLWKIRTEDEDKELYRIAWRTTQKLLTYFVIHEAMKAAKPLMDYINNAKKTKHRLSKKAVAGIIFNRHYGLILNEKLDRSFQIPVVLNPKIQYCEWNYRRRECKKGPGCAIVRQLNGSYLYAPKMLEGIEIKGNVKKTLQFKEHSLGLIIHIKGRYFFGVSEPHTEKDRFDWNE